MAKPVITFRNTKAEALTYSELDTNFQNLRDATINFTDGSNTLSMDLNDIATIQGEVASNLRVYVSDEAGTITVENILGDYTREPMGFENRSDSSISFDAGTRTFTIAPIGTMRVWVKGQMYSKTANETITIPNTTGIYYIYYSNGGTLGVQTGYYDWDDQAPVAYVYWNAVTGTAPYFADERHGIALDWATHEYLHRTRGASFANGFGASNYTTSGDGSSNSHAHIDIANGTFFDEDIPVSITHSNAPLSNTWQQDLQGPAQIPVLYQSGATGLWVKDAATDYAVKQGVTRITYNYLSAGTWGNPDVDNTYYVAYWIVATNNLTTPVMSIMGQRQDNKLSDAQTNNTWNSLDLTNFPSQEFRPLYRLIFRTATAYTNTPKAYLADIEDHRLTSILGAAQAGGVESPAFQNVTVGATTLVADSTSGTLTLVAGTGITLTPNASTDTVTITNSGGNFNSNTITLGDNVSGSVSLTCATNNTDLILFSSPGQFINIRDNGIMTLQGSSEIELTSQQITSVNGTSPYNTIFRCEDNTGTIKGFIHQSTFVQFPNRTTTERNALTAANGMVIYNSTDNKLQVYANGSWVDLH